MSKYDNIRKGVSSTTTPSKYDIIRQGLNEKDPDLIYNNLFETHEEREIQGIDLSNSDYLSGYENPIKQDLDELRASRQPWLTKSSRGVGRVATKVAAELLKMPGVVAGIAGGTVGQISDGITGRDTTDFMKTAFNNEWIKSVAEGEEYTNNELLPVYVRDAVKDGNLWEKISSIDFWAKEGADGLGYVISMLAPGAVINKFSLGSKLFGVSKLAQMGTSTEKAVGVLGKLGITSKNADLITSTLANTAFEAGAEAKSAMDGYRASLMDRLALPEGHSQKINQEEFDKLIEKESTIGAKVFGANAAILVGPNAVMAKMLWGKARNKAVGSIFEGDNFKKLLSPSTLRQVKLYGDDFGKATLREGFWEEGMQSTAENYFTDSKNIDKNLLDFAGDFSDSYINMLGTSDGQSAILLGAVYGGGMQAYAGGKARQNERKSTNALISGANNMMSNLYSVFEEDIYLKEDGIIQYDEDGKSKKDLKKIKDKLLSMDALEAMSLQYDMAVERNDVDTIEQIKDIVSTHVVKPFIVNDNLGIDALKQHLMESERMSNIAEREGISKDSFVSDIIGKATSLKENYNNFQDFAPNLIKLSVEEATKQDEIDFYNKLSMQYVDHHSRKMYLENTLEKKNTQLDSLIKERGRTREEFDTIGGLARDLGTQDLRLKKVNNQVKDILKSLESVNKTIEAFWDGKSANDYFKKEIKEKQILAEKQKLEKSMEDKISSIQNVTSQSELDKIENDIEDKDFQSVFELAKTKKKEELELQHKEASDAAKKAADENDGVSAENAALVEKKLEYFSNNFNEGEIINIPSEFDIDEKFKNQPATIKTISESSITFELETGDLVTISKDSIYDNKSNFEANFSTEGGTTTTMETPQIQTVAQATDDNIVEDKNDASVITNQSWSDPAAIEFERNPRNKKGEAKTVSLNTGKEVVVTNEEHTNLTEELEELQNILKHVNENVEDNSTNEEVSEEVTKVIEKVVEETITEDELAIQAMQAELDAIENALALEQEGKVEEAHEIVDTAIEENKQARKKAAAKRRETRLERKNKNKKILTTLTTTPNIINKLKKLGITLSSKLKNLLNKINNKLKTLLLGITLISALVGGVRSDVGNKFVYNNINKDVANIAQMSLSEISELAPNVWDKVFKVGSYAETTSNLDDLFVENNDKVEEEVFEEFETAPTKETVEPFTSNPVNIGQSVYKRGSKEVRPYVLDLSTDAIKIELATNTRSPKSKSNRDISNARGIMGATHNSFVPQSEAKKDNYPFSLTWDPLSKVLKFKKKEDVNLNDLVLPLDNLSTVKISDLDITPNDKGGFNIKTAKDNDNGTAILRKKDGGSFHIGLGSNNQVGKTLSSNTLKSYRNLRGGMVLFTSEDASVNVVISGSPNDIFSTLRKLQEKYPEKDLYMVRGDTGTYSTSQMDNSGKVTKKDIQFYSNKNTWGDNQIWILKNQETPITKTKEKVNNTNKSSSHDFLISSLLLLGFKKRRDNNESFTQEDVDKLKEEIDRVKDKLKSTPAELKTETGFTGNLKKALDMFNKKDYSDVDFLIKYLPLNVNLTDTVQANLRTYSDNVPETSGNINKPNYNDIWSKSDKWLRSAIIKEVVINGASLSNITTTIAGQKGGTIKVSSPNVEENNLKDLYEFGGDLNKLSSDLIYVVNDQGRLENSKGEPLFAKRKLAKGEMYLKISTANGTPFPLKLNLKKINNEQAELLYELYKYRFEDISKGKSQRLSIVKPELMKQIESTLGDALGLLNKDISDLTIKDLVDFYIWDGTSSPKSQIRFYAQNLLVAGHKLSESAFNTPEGKNTFIHTLTTNKRHHVRFKPRKSDNDSAPTLADRKYVEYLINNKILNTNAVVNEPTFQGDTSIYLKKDNVKVNNKLSEFNNDVPRTFSKLLVGTNDKLKLQTPNLFKRLFTLSTDGKHYINEKGETANRVSSLKKNANSSAKGINVINASTRGNVVDELTRLFFSGNLKKSDFTKRGNVITNQENGKKETSITITNNYFEDLYDILEEYRKEFDRLGFTIYANIPALDGTIGKKGKIAGTIDLLAYDNTNKKWIIIDLKTTTKDRGDYYTGEVEDVWGYQESDQIQQNAYKELFSQKTGLIIDELWIMPITSKADDKTNSIYSSIQKNKSGLFLKVSQEKDIFELTGVNKVEEPKIKTLNLGKLTGATTPAVESPETIELEEGHKQVNFAKLGIAVPKAKPKVVSKGFKFTTAQITEFREAIANGNTLTLDYKDTPIYMTTGTYYFLDSKLNKPITKLEEIEKVIDNHNRIYKPGSPFMLRKEKIMKLWQDRHNVGDVPTQTKQKVEDKKEGLDLDKMSDSELSEVMTKLIANYKNPANNKDFMKIFMGNKNASMKVKVTKIMEYLLSKDVSQEDMETKCGA